MFLFIILVHREFSPEQGQAALDAMIANIDQQQIGGSIGAVRLPGQNRFENPFPDWFQDAARGWQLEYNDVNYCYQRFYSTRAKADAALHWFDTSVRPWIQSRDARWASTVSVRVMDDHADHHEYDSF